jgi:WD40 repeat protein/tetratricopeptide (TPR) repeat protein
MKHDASVVSAEFGPEGERVLTASMDGTARVWDARTAQPLTEPLRHEAPVVAAHFSPDGQRVVTVSETSAAWIWEIRLAQPLTLLLSHDHAIRSACFSSDGQRVLTASFDRTARVWETRTSQLLVETAPKPRFLSWAEFSPNGQRLVTGCIDGTATVYDSTTGRQLFDPIQHGADVQDSDQRTVAMARFSRDGQRVATASRDRTARVWDARNGKRITERLRHDGRVVSIEFSPDEQQVLTASEDQTARTWDASKGQLLLTLKHEGPVNSAHFSPDGLRVVTASADKAARVWNARTGQLMMPPIRHDDTVGEALFSPDGQRIATRSRNTARVWSALTGRPLTDPVKHDSQVNCLRWSPDQKRLVSGCDDGTTQLWDADTGQWVAEPLPQSSGVICVEFSPDGRWIATGTRRGSARLVEVIEAPSPVPAWLAELAEAMAGQRFTVQNQSEPVPVEALFQLRQRIVQDSAAGTLGSWARWLFAPTATRTLSPSSALTVPEYVQRKSGGGNVADQHQIVMLQPTNAIALARLAATLWAQKPEENPRRTNESAWLMRRALELAPDHAYVWQARANLALQRGNLAEALSCCDAALERESVDASLWEFKGTLLLQTNRVEEACQAYQHALGLMRSETALDQKRKADLHRKRAELLAQRDQWQEATADFRQVVELDPSDHLDWRHLAALLVETGDIPGYRSHCQKMLAQFGRTRDVITADQTAQTCLLLPASSNTLSAAYRWADLVVTVEQQLSTLHSCQFTKGLAEYRRERFASAADWMKKIIGQSPVYGGKPYAPREVCAHALLAMVRQQLGQPDAARVALAKAEQVFKTELSQLEYSATEWHNRLIAQILLREARNVVGETKAASQPRAL